MPDGMFGLFNRFHVTQLLNDICSARRRDTQSVCETRLRDFKIVVSFPTTIFALARAPRCERRNQSQPSASYPLRSTDKTR